LTVPNKHFAGDASRARASHSRNRHRAHARPSYTFASAMDIHAIRLTPGQVRPHPRTQAPSQPTGFLLVARLRRLFSAIASSKDRRVEWVPPPGEGRSKWRQPSPCSHQSEGAQGTVTNVPRRTAGGVHAPPFRQPPECPPLNGPASLTRSRSFPSYSSPAAGPEEAPRGVRRRRRARGRLHCHLRRLAQQGKCQHPPSQSASHASILSPLPRKYYSPRPHNAGSQWLRWRGGGGGGGKGMINTHRASSEHRLGWNLRACTRSHAPPHDATPESRVPPESRPRTNLGGSNPRPPRSPP